MISMFVLTGIVCNVVKDRSPNLSECPLVSVLLLSLVSITISLCLLNEQMNCTAMEV